MLRRLWRWFRELFGSKVSSWVVAETRIPRFEKSAFVKIMANVGSLIRHHPEFDKFSIDFREWLRGETNKVGGRQSPHG